MRLRLAMDIDVEFVDGEPSDAQRQGVAEHAVKAVVESVSTTSLRVLRGWRVMGVTTDWHA